MTPKPRRLQVEGTEMVVLTAQDYEKLAGQRRHAGAQASRNRALRDQLEKLNSSHVDEIERAVAELPACPTTPCQGCAPSGDACAREALIDAVKNRPHDPRGRQS